MYPEHTLCATTVMCSNKNKRMLDGLVVSTPTNMVGGPFWCSSVSQSDSESDWQNSELTFSRGGGGGPLSVRDDDLRG